MASRGLVSVCERYPLDVTSWEWEGDNGRDAPSKPAPLSSHSPHNVVHQSSAKTTAKGNAPRSQYAARPKIPEMLWVRDRLEQRELDRHESAASAEIERMRRKTTNVSVSVERSRDKYYYLATAETTEGDLPVVLPDGLVSDAKAKSNPKVSVDEQTKLHTLKHMIPVTASVRERVKQKAIGKATPVDHEHRIKLQANFKSTLNWLSALSQILCSEMTRKLIDTVYAQLLVVDKIITERIRIPHHDFSLPKETDLSDVALLLQAQINSKAEEVMKSYELLFEEKYTIALSVRRSKEEKILDEAESDFLDSMIEFDVQKQISAGSHFSSNYGRIMHVKFGHEAEEMIFDEEEDKYNVDLEEQRISEEKTQFILSNRTKSMFRLPFPETLERSGSFSNLDSHRGSAFGSGIFGAMGNALRRLDSAPPPEDGDYGYEGHDPRDAVLRTVATSDVVVAANNWWESPERFIRTTGKEKYKKAMFDFAIGWVSISDFSGKPLFYNVNTGASQTEIAFRVNPLDNQSVPTIILQTSEDVKTLYLPSQAEPAPEEEPANNFYSQREKSRSLPGRRSIGDVESVGANSPRRDSVDSIALQEDIVRRASRLSSVLSRKSFDSTVSESTPTAPVATTPSFLSNLNIVEEELKEAPRKKTKDDLRKLIQKNLTPTSGTPVVSDANTTKKRLQEIVIEMERQNKMKKKDTLDANTPEDDELQLQSIH